MNQEEKSWVLGAWVMIALVAGALLANWGQASHADVAASSARNEVIEVADRLHPLERRVQALETPPRRPERRKWTTPRWGAQ